MGKYWPSPLKYKDGRKVNTVAEWDERAEEILLEYQTEMYGFKRSGENVAFEINDTGAVLVSFFGTKPAPEAKRMTVKVEKSNRHTEFDVAVFLPNGDKVVTVESEATFTSNGCKTDTVEGVAASKCSNAIGDLEYVKKKGCPVVICMHPIEPIKYANDNGYAVIVLNSVGIASDDYKHTGCFYEIYPYGGESEEQTGVLAAWGWGASKVLDALFAGAGEALGIDPECAIVTGVSRWGKATAVCGAFDKRFRMVAPACSGAGGLALYRYMSEGKTYDLTSKGAPSDYTYGQNEPLSCLQSDAERGWFNDRFVEYKEPEEIPMEQYMLPPLCAGKDRYYFVIASCTNEDWVNAPSMWACFKVSEKIYEFLGVKDNIVANFHKEGHAVIEEDMKYMIEFFNEKIYGIKSELDLGVLKTSVFEEKSNKDICIDEIGADW